jgi:hypothetical protein
MADEVEKRFKARLDQDVPKSSIQEDIKEQRRV